MKAAKKVRLLTKDSKGRRFVKSNNYSILRERAIISEDVILDSENNYEETGVLWIVDEEETKKWEQSKTKDYTEKKQVNKTDEVLEFEGLEVTEANIDDFISDNNIEIGRASTAQGKLAKVKNWIKEQNN